MQLTKRILMAGLALTVVAPLMNAHPRHGRKIRGGWRGAPAAYAVPVYPAPVYPTPFVAPVRWAAPEIACLRSYYGPIAYQPVPAGWMLVPGRPIPRHLRRHLQPIPVGAAYGLAPLPAGYGRGFLGGQVVIYNRGSFVALDVARLF